MTAELVAMLAALPLAAALPWLPGLAAGLLGAWLTLAFPPDEATAEALLRLG